MDLEFNPIKNLKSTRLNLVTFDISNDYESLYLLISSSPELFKYLPYSIPANNLLEL